jgi:hypothetical protein
MKRTIIFASLLLLVCATANAQICTKVKVAGPDVIPPPNNDANLSIMALEKCDGTILGHWQDTFSPVPGDPLSVHAEISCVYVDGNTAWIGGVITHATPQVPGVEGIPIIIQVRDNGRSANDPPDQISFWYFAFTPTDCDQMYDLGMFDVPQGQVQVLQN